MLWALIKMELNHQTSSPLMPAYIFAGLNDQHLIFRTLWVDTFRLGHTVAQESDLSNSNNPPLRLDIIAPYPSNNIVGIMLSDGNGPCNLSSHHGFIVISEAQFYGRDYEPGNIEG